MSQALYSRTLVSYPWTRRQVEDDVDFRRQVVEGTGPPAVRQIPTEVVGMGIEAAIDSQHVMAALSQLGGQTGADEASRSCHQYSHRRRH